MIIGSRTFLGVPVIGRGGVDWSSRHGLCVVDQEEGRKRGGIRDHDPRSIEGSQGSGGLNQRTSLVWRQGRRVESTERCRTESRGGTL